LLGALFNGVCPGLNIFLLGKKKKKKHPRNTSMGGENHLHFTTHLVFRLTFGFFFWSTHKP
jgi:hypothetical protein